jgi:hypothetical protein
MACGTRAGMGEPSGGGPEVGRDDGMVGVGGGCDEDSLSLSLTSQRVRPISLSLSLFFGRRP